MHADCTIQLSDHYSFNGTTTVLAKDSKGKESNRALSKLTQE